MRADVCDRFRFPLEDLAGPTVRIFTDHDAADAWLERCWVMQERRVIPAMRD
jgi:hypothetical protein